MSLQGRPPRISKKLVEEICTHIQLSATEGEAARIAGIDPSTLTRWKNRCDKAEAENNYDSPYAGLCARLSHARANMLVFTARQVVNAAAPRKVTKTKTTTRKDNAGNVVEKTTTEESWEEPGDWRAGAFILERRDRENWRRIDRNEILTPEGESIEFRAPPDQPLDDRVVAAMEDVLRRAGMYEHDDDAVGAIERVDGGS